MKFRDVQKINGLLRLKSKGSSPCSRCSGSQVGVVLSSQVGLPDKVQNTQLFLVSDKQQIAC